MSTVHYIICGIIVTILLLYFNGFKNWLVTAVTEAEQVYGSKTGKLKLQYAYQLAVQTYPVIAKLIPYKLFDWLVGFALKVMRTMIAENKTISEIIQGEISEHVEKIDKLGVSENE